VNKYEGRSGGKEKWWGHGKGATGCQADPIPFVTVVEKVDAVTQTGGKAAAATQTEVGIERLEIYR